MEIEFIGPFDDKKDEKSTVWEEPVPILLMGDTYHCYVHDEITEPYDYAKFCQLLRTAEPDKRIKLYLNTPGGDLSSALAIVDAMMVCKAHITAVLTGTVASGGTIITMYADTLEVSPFVSFMIHYYSGGTFGKGNEIREEVRFSETHKPFIFNTVYDSFLTKKEIKDVVNGKDMWMGMQEILDRWTKKTENV